MVEHVRSDMVRPPPNLGNDFDGQARGGRARVAPQARRPGRFSQRPTGRPEAPSRASCREPWGRA
eukprot:9453236-Pyramimonas_sp.AAC.1